MIRRPPSAAGEPTVVVGERAAPLVARTLSRQARLANALAMGLMVLLGAGTLVWYYDRQFARQSHLRQSRQVAASAAAATEMALPPLDDLFRRAGSPEPPPGRPAGLRSAVLSAAAPAAAAGTHLPVIPLAPAPSPAPSVAARSAASGPTAAERRLQGDVYAAAAPTAAGTPGAPAGVSPAAFAVPLAGSAAQPGLLASPESVPVAARRLRGRSLLLSKGTFIDCTLETAIDSTLPGITSCVTASDTFSADGRVVLLERGTRLFGETQGQVQQGSARVYVLWTEARTPAGIIVPLQSPGTDELGRSGLPGAVQRHFWERFGAAILLSTIDGAVQAAVQASSGNSGAVIYNPGATQDVMTEVLRSTVAIAPTVIKRNGDRIEVLVARDVDFASVYTLRGAGP
ncbi:MAG TPA: type IV secretion system protein VirB10 [Steroidobacteraceae bacterium]|nr:type IV secretion system protein VirB10 [Steroidobacteraceae bacterium]